MNASLRLDHVLKASFSIQIIDPRMVNPMLIPLSSCVNDVVEVLKARVRFSSQVFVVKVSIDKPESMGVGLKEALLYQFVEGNHLLP